MENQRKIFLISDTHLFQESIIRNARPQFIKGGLDQMHQYIIEKWNSVVGKHDIVLHMGDVFVGSPETFEEPVKKIIKQLNGRKALLLGNWDRENWKRDRNLYYRIGFEAVEPDPIMLEKIWISHEPIARLDEGVINYHGHIHNSLIGRLYHLDDRRRNMSVELIDYTPQFLCYAKEWK